MDIDTTIAEMNGYQLRRHRIIIERLCPIYQERKRNQMEDKNRLNSDTVVMLQTDPYEIRLMQNPYDAAVGVGQRNRIGSDYTENAPYHIAQQWYGAFF